MAARMKENLNTAMAKNEEAFKIIANDVEDKKVKKDNSQKLITFYLNADSRDEYKKFFGAKGKSMAEGIRICLDYVYQGVMDGSLNFTESGIRENKLKNL